MEEAEWPKEEVDLLAYLESMKEKAQIERIGELIHFLEYQRRLLMLTEEEKNHMCDESLSPAMREKLDQAKSETEREKLIQSYARGIYFRRCAWVSYLKGETLDKPFDSKRKGKVA